MNSVVTYVERPYTHRVNHVGTTVFRLVGIANRTAGAMADSDDVSGLSATPELMSKWYRAHRLVLKAGQATALHRHARPVVVVMQTPGTASASAALADGVGWLLGVCSTEGRRRHQAAVTRKLRSSSQTPSDCNEAANTINLNLASL